MLPGHIDSRSHVVSQDDEFLMVCGVMGANTYDVYPRTADQIEIFVFRNS